MLHVNSISVIYITVPRLVSLLAAMTLQLCK